MAIPPTEAYWTRTVPDLKHNVTTGDQHALAGRKALDNIPGTAKGMPDVSNTGTPTSDYTRAVRGFGGIAGVYPHFDGGTNTLPAAERPATFGSNAPADFVTWHSGYQAEWLGNGNPATPRALNLTGAGGGYFVLSTDQKTVIDLNALTLADYAKMSVADKTAYSGTIMTIGVGARLGLTNVTTAVDNTIANAKSVINANGATHQNMTAADKAVFLSQITLIETKLTAFRAGNELAAPDKISQEVAEIIDRYNRAKTFKDTRSPAAMTSIYFRDVDGIERYVSVDGVTARGYSIDSHIPPAGQNWWESTPIRKGFDEFMRAERAILTQKQTRESLSAQTTFRDPKADVPNLIYKLQLMYEAEAEGIADSGTEEIRQIHKLLQDYGVMQQLVNETIKFYNPKEAEEKRRFMDIGGESDGGVDRDQHSTNNDTYIRYFFSGTGSVLSPNGTADSGAYKDSPAYHWFLLESGVGANDAVREVNGNDFVEWARTYYASGFNNGEKRDGNLTPQQMAIFSMFNKDKWATDKSQGHPIERLLGIDRPTHEFTDETNEGAGSLKLHFKPAWDQFSTQLSDRVTQINQGNQLRQNDIESATKRQNRHFELGNNALRKMNDMIMTIGRM